MYAMRAMALKQRNLPRDTRVSGTLVINERTFFIAVFPLSPSLRVLLTRNFSVTRNRVSTKIRYETT